METKIAFSRLFQTYNKITLLKMMYLVYYNAEGNNLLLDMKQSTLIEGLSGKGG